MRPDTPSTTSRFAAGSGITPVLSLIKTTLAREPRSRFTLVYGNRRLSTIMFQEELEDLKDRYLTRFRLYNLFTREEQEVELFNGRLDAAKVTAFPATLIPVDTIDEAFVCGPGAMIDEVEAGADRGRRCLPSTFTWNASACPVPRPRRRSTMRKPRRRSSRWSSTA